jgi:hypothetical protein
MMLIDSDKVRVEKRALEQVVENAVGTFQKATGLVVSSLCIHQVHAVTGDRIPFVISVRASIDLDL